MFAYVDGRPTPADFELGSWEPSAARAPGKPRLRQEAATGSRRPSRPAGGRARYGRQGRAGDVGRLRPPAEDVFDVPTASTSVHLVEAVRTDV